jgi:hypothetical protein
MKKPKIIIDIRKLRKEEDYSALGWIYWDAFMLMDRKTKLFKAIEKEYKKLSKYEQSRLEEV